MGGSIDNSFCSVRFIAGACFTGMKQQVYIAQLTADEVTNAMHRNVENGVQWGISASVYAMALLAAVGLIGVAIARLRH